MMIPLMGGPYDGREIRASDLRQHATLLTLRSDEGKRRFTYLPEPADWQAVVEGRMKVDQSKQYHYYELIDTAEGQVLRFDPDREAYWEAINRAIEAMPDRNGKVLH